MDIIEWFFKNKKEGAQLSQIAALKRRIRKESHIFHLFLIAYKRKQELVKKPGFDNNSLLQANDKLVEQIRQLRSISNLSGVLVKKAIAESAEGLHRISHTLNWYGSNPAVKNPHVILLPTLKGRRTPYNIEDAKQRMWHLTRRENDLERFVDKFVQSQKGEFQSFDQLCYNLQTVVQDQSSKYRTSWPTESEQQSFDRLIELEKKLVVKIRKSLADIVNNLIRFTRDEKKVALTESELTLPKRQRTKSKVGVMLIHGITASPREMQDLEDFLNGGGFVTYNIRLPGHGQNDLELFANTSLDELEEFLKSAFKYFYLQLKKLNKGGDARFYVIGHSMGAMLITHLFASTVQGKFIYQSMVRGFVSISQALYLYPIYQHVIKVGFLDRWMTGWGVPFYFKLAAKMGVIQKKREKTIKSLAPGSMHGHSRKTMERMGQQLLRLRDEIKYVNVPTLVIQGGKDKLAHPTSAYYIKEHIGTARSPGTKRADIEWLFLKGSAHHPLIDEGKSTIFTAALNFIDNQEEKQYPQIALAASQRD